MNTASEGTAPNSAPKRIDVAIVGAGFGGIAAALRLRAKGYAVTLIDRCAALGGRAQVYEREGFRHDAGPTVMTKMKATPINDMTAKNVTIREDGQAMRPVCTDRHHGSLAAVTQGAWAETAVEQGPSPPRAAAAHRGQTNRAPSCAHRSSRRPARWGLPRR